MNGKKLYLFFFPLSKKALARVIMNFCVQLISHTVEIC